MASASVPAATAAGASLTAGSAASSSSSAPLRRPPGKAVFFRLVPKPRLRLVSSSKVSRLNPGGRRSCVLVVSAQMNEVAGGPSNDAATTAERKAEVPAPLNGAVEAPSAPTSPEAVSEFMTQVASLVKLVDSKDIIELQLKQQDCELVIRKKEALPQSPTPAPVIMMQPHGPAPVLQSHPPPAAPAPAGAAALPAPPPPPASAAKSAKSSHPPLKSPMSGTFYRNPGPGQPPFVKVGDKVNKGQVLCIIEAMKLMNEIEADQAGTIVEILVEDAKSVSIDQPLFVIEP